MATTGRAIILTGLTAPVGGSGNVYPNINDLLEYVPRPSLQEAFVAQRVSLITKDGGGIVSAWQGLLGAVAANVAGLRPTYGALSIAGAYPGVTGDGVDDVLLNTAVAMPTSGYLAVAFQQAASPGATEAHAGGQNDATNRAYLGHRTNGANIVAAGALGSVNQNTLSGTTALVAGNRYVVGMRWHAGTVILRLNKVQENSQSYTGSAGTKNLALNAFASGAAGLLYSKASIGAVALYSADSAVLNNTYLDQIDTAMGVVVGLIL